MNVANVDGPWVTELRIPDKRVGHVLAAQQELGSDLEVTFILATHPGVTYRGRVVQLARRTDMDEAGQPVVQAHVSFDQKIVKQLRPGATVIAQIDCGQRSIAYVWLHAFIDAIRTRLMF